MEGLLSDQRGHGIGQLDFAASPLFLRFEDLHHVGLQDIAARQDEIGGRGAERRLFDQPLDLRQHAIARTRIDHAIARRLFHRNFKRADQIAANLFIGIDHLLHAAVARRALHELVGQQDGEGFVADDVARAPDGVSQTQRLLLAQEHRIARQQPRPVKRRQILAALALGRLRLIGDVEIILDRALAAPGDEDHLLDPCLQRFVHCVLDQRTVDDRQQFLGHRLGRGQEASAKSRDRENGFADRFVGHATPFSLQRGMKQGIAIPVAKVKPYDRTITSS